MGTQFWGQGYETVSDHPAMPEPRHGAHLGKGALCIAQPRMHTGTHARAHTYTYTHTPTYPHQPFVTIFQKLSDLLLLLLEGGMLGGPGLIIPLHCNNPTIRPTSGPPVPPPGAAGFSKPHQLLIALVAAVPTASSKPHRNPIGGPGIFPADAWRYQQCHSGLQ